MLALVAAVLFALALILTLIGTALGPLTAQVFLIAGFICVALFLAGIGSRSFGRNRSRRYRD